jgi:hypothetical protein
MYSITCLCAKTIGNSSFARRRYKKIFTLSEKTVETEPSIPEMVCTEFSSESLKQRRLMQR